MNRFLVLMILFLVISCNTQPKEALTDAQKIEKILTEAEDALNIQVSPDSLLQLHLDYLDKAKKYKDPIHVYRSEFKMAEFWSKRGLDEEAVNQYEKARNTITIDPDSSRYVQVTSNMGLIHINIGNLGKAAEMFYHANKVAKRNQLDRFVFETKMNIGYVNLDENKITSSIKTFKEGISYVETNNLIEKEPNTYLNQYIILHTLIAKAYNRAQLLDSALVYNTKALAINEKYRKNKRSRANSLIQKGEIYQQKKAFSKAFESFEEAKKLFIIEQNETQVSNILYHIATCYYEKKSYKEVLSVVEDLEIRKHSNNVSDDDYSKILELTRNTHLELKEYKKASLYTTKLENHKASKNSRKDKEHKRYLNTIYNYEELEGNFQEEKHKKSVQFYAMLVLILIIVGVLGIISYKLRQATKKKIAVKKGSSQPLIDDKTVADILKKLKKLEESQFYLNPKYNLYATAKKIETNTTYLSTILNVHQKMTFTEYINALRITYAIDRLQTDEQFRHYTVKAIAKEVGYKSHSPFSRAFKAKTGLNPSEYIKNLS